MFLAWDEDDRVKALAWKASDSDRCAGCGQFHDDWSTPTGRPVEPAPLEYVKRVCWSCNAISAARRSISDDERDATRIIGRRPVPRPTDGGDAPRQ